MLETEVGPGGESDLCTCAGGTLTTLGCLWVHSGQASTQTPSVFAGT